jgi:Dehydrogenases (flavoproteins)
MLSTLTLEAACREPWETVIIGAGPAGALAAYQLAQLGCRVLLVERKSFPRRKVCGGCLNGQALALLRSAGLRSVMTEIKGLPLSSFQMRAQGLEAAFDLPEGLAISRASLDAALVGAAITAGAEFLAETTAHVEGVRNDQRSVLLDQRGSLMHASGSVVLLAGGLACAERELEMQSVVDPQSRVAAGCLLKEAPADYEGGTIYMAVGTGGYVGLVRVEDGQLNVAAAFDRDFMRNCGAPGAAAAEILSESGYREIAGLETTNWHGTVSLTRHLAILASERMLVIGDAAGYIEPFTGEGMAWALASAQLAVPFVRAGIKTWSLALEKSWQVRLPEVLGHRQWVCRQLSFGLRRPWLVRNVMRVLSQFPGLARPIIQTMNAPLKIPENRQDSSDFPIRCHPSPVQQSCKART